MRTITTRLRRAPALVALAALVWAAPARAQQGFPDIRGTYPVSGAVTIFSCTVGEGGTPPISTVPVSIDLVITDQDGASFSGYLGLPEPQTVYYTITGQVSSEGLIGGTWEEHFDAPLDLLDRTFTGEISNGKAAIELTATFGVEDVSCQYRVALSSDSVILSWVAPVDPTDQTPLPPPQQLQAFSAAAPQKVAKTGAATPTGYNVYRSTTPNVETTPGNLFTSVPPTQTTVPAPDGSDGSFFVVTATYDSGESGPSNEVSGGVPAATLTSVRIVKGTKLVAKGKDFTSSVQVLVDGIPFGAPAKVKGSAKVVQKGALLTGQSLADYITPGRTVTITFRNANGGVATKIYPEP
jgi:hypothetical protein